MAEKNVVDAILVQSETGKEVLKNLAPKSDNDYEDIEDTVIDKKGIRVISYSLKGCSSPEKKTILIFNVCHLCVYTCVRPANGTTKHTHMGSVLFITVTNNCKLGDMYLIRRE